VSTTNALAGHAYQVTREGTRRACEWPSDTRKGAHAWLPARLLHRAGLLLLGRSRIHELAMGPPSPQRPYGHAELVPPNDHNRDGFKRC